MRQVATPYVNHVPTMTGGVGYDDLARFYKVSEITMLQRSAYLYLIVSFHNSKGNAYAVFRVNVCVAGDTTRI